MMERSGHVSRGQARGAWPKLAALAVLLLSGWPAGEAAGQHGGLFTAVSPSAAAVNAAQTDPDRLTLRRRLVTIKVGQFAPATDSAARTAAAGFEIAPGGC